ncbi:hypothetical protein ACI784_24645 [Geodermatophilus sp. SYSU D01186]
MSALAWALSAWAVSTTGTTLWYARAFERVDRADQGVWFPERRDQAGRRALRRW